MIRTTMLIDLDRCIGCHTCTLACQMEKGLAPGLALIPVSTAGGRQDVPQGTFPALHMDYLPRPCAHCRKPACADSCPTGALLQRDDGLVTVDASLCTGCRACLDACPYGAISMDQDDIAHKCDMCASRLDQSLEPFCSICCPTRAISVARSKPAETGRVLAPEFGGEPALRYLTKDEARWGRVSNELAPRNIVFP